MFEDVKILLSDLDREILIDYASKANLLEGEFLEIGSYHGGSALYICHAMSNSKKLNCVDINRHKQFNDTIKRYGLENRIDFYHMDYKDFLKNHSKGKKYSFIFVDNDHTYESTKLLREALWENLTVGGYMIFHDYSHRDYPGVKRYLDEFSRSCQDANVIGPAYKYSNSCSFVIQKCEIKS